MATRKHKPSPKKRQRQPRKLPPKKRQPKKRRALPKKRAPRKAPTKRGPRLVLYRRRGLPPGLEATALVLVVAGALGGERLSIALSAQEVMTRWLGPVAELTSLSAWTREWRFVRRPVDADTILPALAEVMPELDVGDRLSLSLGVLEAGSGAYVPLAFRSASLAGAADESRANAARDRAKYQKSLGQPKGEDGDRADAEAELTDQKRKKTFYELRVAYA